MSTLQRGARRIEHLGFRDNPVGVTVLEEPHAHQPGRNGHCELDVGAVADRGDGDDLPRLKPKVLAVWFDEEAQRDAPRILNRKTSAHWITPLRTLVASRPRSGRHSRTAPLPLVTRRVPGSVELPAKLAAMTA